MPYDAIVIGGRIGGSTTARLLAQEGHRVLLVDRASFPSDTISTHFFHPLGCSYLNRHALLQEVTAQAPEFTSFTLTREGISITGAPPLDAIQARLRTLHGDDAGATIRWCAPRRTFLDKLLLDRAAAAGVEVREGFPVDELVFDGDRVTGIRGRANRQTVSERAKIVVGADGKHSSLARAVGATRYGERPKSSFAYYSYWSGLSLADFNWPLHLRGRLAVAAFPTNDQLTHILVFGPHEWFKAFRTDIETNYMRILELVAPELAEHVRTEGKREERIYGTADQPNFFHKPWGPGWALVGDAGYSKDQCTAIGMTHAFRDSELLATAIGRWLRGGDTYENALSAYHATRDANAQDYYGFVCDLAEMNAPQVEEIQLFAALADNPAAFGRFLAVFGDAEPVAEFFAPESIGQIMSGAGASLADCDVLQNFGTLTRDYDRNPFLTEAAH